MADRSVSVKLLADVRGFVSGLQRANAESKKLAGDMAKHARDNEQAWEQTGRTFMGVGLAAGAGLGLAVAAFANFDAQMSEVQAATGETGATLDALRESAMRAGADTKFSATEAAAGITELSKAGVSAEDILGGGLDGALALASAGNLDVASAAQIAATALTQFKLEGEDVTHVADLLAAGAGKAQGDVQDLGAALNQSGQVAEATGLSIEETTGALTAFASAGLLGSDAGTSFKAMLQRLTPQSLEAKNLMDELGISAYDAQGQFIGLSEFAGNLEDALKDLTPEQRNAALATIFGSDAVRAANVLYTEGAAGIEQWTQAVNDQGFAAEQAAAKMDNLRGDAEEFLGSVETTLIGLGEGADGPLRELTQDATTFVNILGEMPDEAQQAALLVGTVTAAVGLAGGAAFLATPKLVAANAALASMGPAGAKAAAGLRGIATNAGPIGLALTGLSIAGGLVLDSYIEQKQAVDEYASSLDEATGAITENTRASVVKTLQDEGALDAARVLGLELGTVTDAALGNAEAMRIVGERIEDARNYSEDGTSSLNALGSENLRVSDSADRLSGVLGDQNGALAEARDQWLQQNEALNGNAEAVNKAATEHYEATGAIEGTGAAAGNMAVEVADAKTEIDNLNTALSLLFDEQLSMQEAADNTAQAIADMAQKTADAKLAAEEAGTAFVPLTESIYAQTQAGRDNRDMIDATIRAIGDEAVVMAERGIGIGKITDKTYASRDALVAELQAMGYSREEALEYTSVLEDVPALVETTVTTPGMQRALDDAAYLKTSLDNIPKSVRVDITTYESTIRQDIAQANRGGNQPREQANGGLIEAAANGLMREPMLVRGGQYGRGIMWAEPETGWEAYISGKPGKEARNRSILAQAAARLGLAVTPAADGRAFGMPSQVPFAALAGSGGPAPEVHRHVHVDGSLAAIAGTLDAQVRLAVRESEAQMARRLEA